MEPNMGCTVFYASDGGIALGGNNEDYSNPSTMAWFVPPEGEKYGRVYFGYEGFLWGGGMNDQGLFFDALAIDQPMDVPSAGKPLYDGSLPDKALSDCSTVDCVVALFSQYHTNDTWYHQFMFGDAFGNSVIVEPNQFITPGENYQVATNFYQSQTYIPTCNTCTRYLKVTGMLAGASEYTVDLFRDILAAASFEGAFPTLYSNIYDLKTRTIYLYNFHDFDHVVVWQLDEELAKGAQSYRLADLFPENQAYIQFAKPELDQLESLRAAYPEFQGDPGLYGAFVGDYAVPPEMGLPYPYFSIAIKWDSLILKIKPDKAWLPLVPLTETSFYHVSSFAHIEVNFLPDADGQVNQFEYIENGSVYTLSRMMGEASPPLTPTPTKPVPSPSVTSTEIPTLTAEPPTPTPVPLTNTPSTLQLTPTPGEDIPSGNPLYWVIPGTFLVILAGWFLVRRRKI
jgi:hypothetical protein